MSELEKFLEERSRIPIPNGDVARVHLLAKDLALGVHRNLWGRNLKFNPNSRLKEVQLLVFYGERWQQRDSLDHDIELLQAHGFADESGLLTQAAFDLLTEVAPFDVFVSYKRSESSAFALLVSFRLKERGLVPFVDMAINVGEKWYDELHKRIKECDYFIVLLGRNTLKSEMTIQEIKWAIKYREQNIEEEVEEKKIIPIWHSGFNITHKRWQDVDQAVRDEISANNAIIVQDESASGYNSAIVELLNRFGVTP